MKKILVYTFVFTLALGTAALAGDFTYTVPTAGVTPGPTWASQISTALTILKTHTHTGAATEGPQLGSAALSVDADISFNSSYAATDLQHTTYTSQASSGSVANKSVYVLNNDLYYKNNSGTAVRLTNGSSTAQTSEGIFGDYRNTSGTAYWDSSNSVLLMMTSATTPSYSESDVATNVIDLGTVMAEDFQLQGGTNAPEIFIRPGGLADVGHVVFAFDDDSEIGSPTFSAEDGEASNAIGVWSRRANSAGTGTTYYGDGLTVDEDYGHLTIGQGDQLTELSDGEWAGQISSNGKCDDSTVNCAHYPNLQVQGGAYPAEIMLKSDDQTGIYFYDAKSSAGAATSRLFAIKQASGTTDATNVLDIGAYTSGARIGGINILGDGTVTSPILKSTNLTIDVNAVTRYFGFSSCAYTLTGTVSYDQAATAENGMVYDESTQETWNAYCPIPISGTDADIDSIVIYFDADDAVGNNCQADFYVRQHAFTTASNATQSVSSTNAALDSTLADPISITLSTDVVPAAATTTMHLVIAPENNGAACDELDFLGYAVTYKTGSTGGATGYLNPNKWNE